jgi:hypothetical protein
MSGDWDRTMNEVDREATVEGFRLYERYGKPLESKHRGEYVAIAPDGRTVLARPCWKSCSGRPPSWDPATTSSRSESEPSASGADGPGDQHALPLPPNPTGCETAGDRGGGIPDTGFDGDVVMPRAPISSTANPDSFLYWALADGSPVRAPAYLGTVHMKPLGSFPVVVTILGDEPLIGRRLADRFRVTRDHGARVIIEP